MFITTLIKDGKEYAVNFDVDLQEFSIVLDDDVEYTVANRDYGELLDNLERRISLSKMEKLRVLYSFAGTLSFEIHTIYRGENGRYYNDYGYLLPTGNGYYYLPMNALEEFEAVRRQSKSLSDAYMEQRKVLLEEFNRIRNSYKRVTE